MARSPITRLSRSLQRKPGKRLPRSTTLVVCEGETERAYFKTIRHHYRLSNAEIVIAETNQDSAPINVVTCAKQKNDRAGGYDHIYCVFDRNGHESFERAREMIRSLARAGKNALPIQEIVSIPCFEVWILLHFERTDTSFGSCHEVIQRVRSHLPRYEKTDEKISKHLINHLDTALAHADWLAGRGESNRYNPYTTVQTLLRHLQSVSSQ